MRLTGKLTSWNDEKGFGFISPESGGKRIFVHIKGFSNRRRRPELNQEVTYLLSTDNQGRPCAIKVSLPGGEPADKTRRKKGSFSLLVAALFIAIVVVTVLVGKVSPLILALYLVASLLTFVAYAIDKSAARKGAWRTQESTLHFLSLIGGWPGALVAQQVLRHKSRKQAFQSVFWTTVLLNCIAFAWLFTPDGTALFQSLIMRIMYG